MSRRHMHLSRRQVLAAVGTVGTIGAVAGAGTGAYLSDRETYTNAAAAGTVDIAVACDACSPVDGTLAFGFDDLDRGVTGTLEASISVESNPARLWLRTSCPPETDPLGDAIEGYLTADGTLLATGTLTTIARALATGVRLDSDCLEPATPLDLELEWELPETVSDSLAGESTTFVVDLVAEQCRHIDEAAMADPFAGVEPCAEPPACVDCPRSDDERIASATFEYDGPGDPVLLELVRSVGTSEPGRTVEPGDTFTAVFHDPPGVTGNADFDVVVDGVTIGDFHTSCSQPFGPGLEITDGTHTLTVLEAFDADGNRLCEVSN
ncbi:SipW-dependent-type signal peptide-containing protein [Halobacteria archaeon AArc-curdl1]|uniref:SipW-dependent-type signal peptide-containing protein n=1 Tax=Natronosalvus hydrolyticus TaxID=2979988 RepID=A0AAP2ZAS1_9EURY|nr:SipW-dependent-type signal peptide-containing protein [Halobacteria archaeon AArc-curdl1]